MTDIAGFPSRISNSVRLGWGPGICVSYKFPGNAEAAVPGILL